AQEIVALALRMQKAGAAAILLEAVPPEVANAVIEAVNVPVIGCGAGPGCHGCVIVTHDGLGLSLSRPRFVPTLGELSEPMTSSFDKYIKEVESGEYPANEHNYAMSGGEAVKLRDWMKRMRQIEYISKDTAEQEQI